jgi:hypothetical protein
MRPRFSGVWLPIVTPFVDGEVGYACGIGSWGSWGGQRPSVADYVRELAATRGRSPPEGANVGYAL